MSERLTLMLTLLVGALGWLFTHLVDRAASSPTIEYVLTDNSAERHSSYSIDLTNITRSHSFADIEIIVTAPPNGKILEAHVVPKQPASEGDVEPTHTDSSAVFHLQRFMPGASAKLITKYEGPERPRFRATALEGTARFVERNLETNFVRNEFRIFVGLVCLTALALIGIFIGAASVSIFPPSKRGKAQGT